MTDSRALEVSVVTPEGSAYEGQALSVVAPAFDGEIAFYPMHAPFVGVLGHGELRVTRADDGKTEYFYLAGGVAQVADDTVSVLAETVLPVSELNSDTATGKLEEVRTAEARGDYEIDQRLERMDDARARIRTALHAEERGIPTAKEILDQPVE